MKNRNLKTITSLLAATVLATCLGPQLLADDFAKAMEWRCVGPFVGVRGCGVEMHPTDRNVFYHAHSSGGVWKTEDAGQYWIPITDGQINVGSVGAIAVSRSKRYYADHDG